MVVEEEMVQEDQTSEERNDNIPIQAPLSEERSSEDEGPVAQKRPLKRRRRSYLPLAKVAKVFKGIAPATLCKLSEMVEFSPSAVLEIVPSATSNQLSFSRSSIKIYLCN